MVELCAYLRCYCCQVCESSDPVIEDEEEIPTEESELPHSIMDDLEGNGD